MSIAEIAVPRLPYIHALLELPTVLIVEDERKLRWSLTEQFGLMSIEALTTSSGYEAIRVAGEERPDLILLDGLLRRCTDSRSPASSVASTSTTGPASRS
jgi:hypothetical protein